MQRPSQAQHLGPPDEIIDQRLSDHSIYADPPVLRGHTTYGTIRIADSARAHLGDQDHRNHGVIINASNVEIGSPTLQQFAQIDLSSPSPRRSFGLCLGQAPLIDEEAFIGRTAELQQLQDWFSHDGTVQKVVSIVGMGGLGKTQLSLTFARQNKDRYTSIFWVNAKDELSLRQGLSSLARIIFGDDIHQTANNSGEQRRVELLRHWLSEDWNSQWLVIFDNYDDPNLPNIRSAKGLDIRSYFPHRVQGHILITTRSTKLTFSKQLNLRKLENVELSIAVLSQRSGRDLATDTSAEEIAVKFDGLPLALATAGLYIGQTDISCEEYLQAYESAWIELCGPSSDKLLEYEDRTLFSTWIVSFDRVCELDTDAAELFKFWVYFSNKDIWYELIQAGADTGPPWMHRITSSKIRFNRAISRLQEYSLVEAAAGSYSIHPCVHTWASEYFRCEPTALIIAARCIAYSVPDMKFVHYWQSTQRLLPHIDRLNDRKFRTLWKECLLDHEGLPFNNLFGSTLALWSLGDQAEKMYMRALTVYQQVLGYQHKKTVDALHELGTFYAIRSALAKAEKLYAHALTILEQSPNHDRWPVLEVTNALGVIYRRQGNFDQAERMSLRALAGRRQVMGFDHPLTIPTLANLNTLYQSQGRLDEALQVSSQILCIIFGTDTSTDWTPTIWDLARNLAIGIKDWSNSSQYQRCQLVHLTDLTKTYAYVLYFLARALFWIGDRKTTLIAFSQVENAVCDSCNMVIHLTHGHYICYECEDADFCNECMAKYTSNRLSLERCNGHKHFNIGLAIYTSANSLIKMSTAEMNAWLDELRQIYSSVADS